MEVMGGKTSVENRCFAFKGSIGHKCLCDFLLVLLKYGPYFQEGERAFWRDQRGQKADNAKTRSDGGIVSSGCGYFKVPLRSQWS